MNRSVVVKVRRIVGATVAVLTLGSSAMVLAERDGTTQKTESKTTVKRTAKKTTTTTEAKSETTDPPAADNTKVNERDRAPSAVTADQQKNNKSDLTVTAEIRRAVIAEKSLSSNAHNVKIIAVNGVVTLKGPVKNVSEKTIVEEKAITAVGKSNVKSEIEVQP